MPRLITPRPGHRLARVIRPATRTFAEVRHGAFGGRIAKHFHVQSEAALLVQTARGNPIAATRVRSVTGLLEPTTGIPPEKAFLVLLQLRDVPSHELWLDGRSTKTAFWSDRSVSVVDLAREPRAFIPYPFDTLQFYMPRGALDEIADESGVGHVGTLSCSEGTFDPIVRHLGAAVLELLTQPEEADALLLSHIAYALASHLVHTYGGVRPPSPAAIGGLASWQERRSKELMIQNIEGNVSLGALAEECGLSRSYFARAFKKTTGRPPHRWLLEQRVEMAKKLLMTTSIPIADIALAVGFADQGHLTKVFARLAGITPGTLRRSLDGRSWRAPKAVKEAHGRIK